MTKHSAPATPYSAGARYERKAFRTFLRRRVRYWEDQSETLSAELEAILAWVLKRQQRYDKRSGGL